MKRLFLIIIIFLPINLAWAVKVSSLYQIETPVVSQSVDERGQAVKQGFIQVLMKLSGDPLIEKNPVIKASLKKAEYYVQEYSYAAPTTSSAQYLLQITFGKEDIDRLLKKAEVSYWGENRPLILVWMTLTPLNHDAEIIDNEESGPLLNTMTTQAKKYGIPLIFPMMDVTDIDQVSATDVTSVSLPVLKAVGKRYAPDALLIGNVQQDSEGYRSEWQLILNDNQWKWEIADKTEDNVIFTLMNQVSQTLAKHYVDKTPHAPQFWMKLEVANITERNDLNQLMQYLKQLTLVQQIQLLQVSGDTVKLSLLVQGSLDTFQQNASIGQHLILKSQDLANNQLAYEWVH